MRGDTRPRGRGVKQLFRRDFSIFAARSGNWGAWITRCLSGHIRTGKERGITIFSKQAVLRTAGMEITLLDTPGHVDFSAEMERTLQVLDYAVLVISGMDGVQSHTMTLWKLLERYQIPVFLFINKMDQEGTDRDGILSDLKKRLDENCIDFSADTDREEWMENVSLCDETLMESYLESGK